MAYATKEYLNNLVSIPVCLPTTEIIQGDWLVIGTVRLLPGNQAMLKFLSITLHDANVPIPTPTTQQLINPNLGLAFVGVYFNYASGHPGTLAALEALPISDIGTVAKEPSSENVLLTNEGNYSVVVANNIVPITEETLIASNFRVSVSGAINATYTS